MRGPTTYRTTGWPVDTSPALTPHPRPTRLTVALQRLASVVTPRRRPERPARKEHQPCLPTV
jgi:hypothetical protein